MYFATNLPILTLPSEIAQEFEELRAAQLSGALHLLALVDCAFDEAILDNRYPQTLPPQSLYHNTALQKFGAAVSHLLTSPDGGRVLGIADPFVYRVRQQADAQHYCKSA